VAFALVAASAGDAAIASAAAAANARTHRPRRSTPGSAAWTLCMSRAPLAGSPIWAKRGEQGIHRLLQRNRTSPISGVATLEDDRLIVIRPDRASQHSPKFRTGTIYNFSNSFVGLVLPRTQTYVASGAGSRLPLSVGCVAAACAGG